MGEHYAVTLATLTVTNNLILQVIIKSPQLGHMIIVCVFNSTSINPITNKFHSKGDQHALIFPFRYDNITTVRSCDPYLYLYFYFFKSYNNQTS